MTSYSLFFKDLASRGHVLSFFQADSQSIALKVYGENQYDNIVMFAPAVESFSTFSFEDLNDFVEEGGNVLLAADREVSDGVRQFVQSFGVTFDKKGTEVIDHFENEVSLDSRYGYHTTLLSWRLLLLIIVFSSLVLGFHNVQSSAPHCVG
jgi:oligosaccharyltransferase complex subunit beta